MRIRFNFVILIFVASIDHENILTTKISRFTVYYLDGVCVIIYSRSYIAIINFIMTLLYRSTQVDFGFF